MTGQGMERQRCRTDSDDVGPVMRWCFLNGSAILLIWQTSTIS